jgi:hypothetical protein
VYLSAISVGDAVPRIDFDAVVHSVFQSAINLRPSGKSELLTLVTSSEADLPQGIRVDTPSDFTFERFHVGEPVTCQDDNLRIDSLTIQLRGARRWKCDLSKLEFDARNPAVPAAWSFVWDVLNDRQKFSKAEIIAEDLLRTVDAKPIGVLRKAGEAMRDLVARTRRRELTDSSVVNSLIGLGSGLTPSGDDLLIGYMAGLWCTTQDKSGRLQFISNLGETIIDLSSKTNDISRTYLYYASQGQVSSLLADLAEAISLGENPERLFGVAEAAMHVGHTSGMDVVTGLLIGLVTWDGNYILS